MTLVSLWNSFCVLCRLLAALAVCLPAYVVKVFYYSGTEFAGFLGHIPSTSTCVISSENVGENYYRGGLENYFPFSVFLQLR